MPGFNYGGKGDGTNWSSERGTGPEPGGGDKGHSGDRDRGGAGVGNSPEQQQIAAIQNDPALRMKLEAVIKAARRINPDAKLHIESVSSSGTLSLSATGLTAEQAKHIGLGAGDGGQRQGGDSGDRGYRNRPCAQILTLAKAATMA